MRKERNELKKIAKSIVDILDAITYTILRKKNIIPAYVMYEVSFACYPQLTQFIVLYVGRRPTQLT